MRQHAKHRCDFCGGNAVAFQRGASVCGRCGIDRTAGRSNSSLKTKRMALVSLFSSGLLIKMMLGSVALAAVGGWAASAVLAPSPGTAPPHTQSTAVDESPTTAVESVIAGEEPAMTVNEIVTEANEQAAAAHDLATAVKKWADCVSAAAIEHRGGAFDPSLTCPAKPHPSDFGLGQSQRPEHAANPDHPAKPEQANNGNKDKAPGAENRSSDEDRDKDKQDDEKKPKDAPDDGDSDDR